MRLSIAQRLQRRLLGRRLQHERLLKLRLQWQRRQRHARIELLHAARRVFAAIFRRGRSRHARISIAR